MKLIYLILVLSMLSCRAQKDDSIVYILPDSVEVKLNEYLNESEEFTYFILYNLGSEYELFVERDDEYSSRSFANIIMSSKRKVLVNNKKYPLLLDSDFDFMTPDINNVGKFGERDGWVKRVQPVFHSYSLKFTTKGISKE